MWFSVDSIEQAQASHLYSYRHGFRGFAAKLTDEQASHIARKFVTFLQFIALFWNENEIYNNILVFLDRDAWSSLCVSQFEKEVAHHSFMGFHGAPG
jgi:hypothetical protein